MSDRPRSPGSSNRWHSACPCRSTPRCSTVSRQTIANRVGRSTRPNTYLHPACHRRRSPTWSSLDQRRSTRHRIRQQGDPICVSLPDRPLPLLVLRLAVRGGRTAFAATVGNTTPTFNTLAIFGCRLSLRHRVAAVIGSPVRHACRPPCTTRGSRNGVDGSTQRSRSRPVTRQPRSRRCACWARRPVVTMPHKEDVASGRRARPGGEALRSSTPSCGATDVSRVHTDGAAISPRWAHDVDVCERRVCVLGAGGAARRSSIRARRARVHQGRQPSSERAHAAASGAVPRVLSARRTT